MIRLFIDECLSASLAAQAKERGIAADYGPYIGMAGYQDWNISPFAFDNGYTVVTNNRRHFLREYSRQELHKGLIVIVPNVGRGAQSQLFGLTLDMLGSLGDAPVNRLIEVLADGRIRERDWTLADHNDDHISRPKWAD